ncbi:sodium:proton exchanger [Candidatus Woesearchaeota archaeon CG10_big_fil_rev_8_21_14_0_10_32_9]|nr:MAG: sodium:proton exchanger [Candidatus Woesearchaeota archaeon CG10_big_fil_rev_8_21_14_0_10_32_9]
MIEYIFFVLGFLFLIKGAEFLVDGASSLAKHFKVSDLFIGLTVVAFGTSFPELMVNISSAVHLEVNIGVGNILGSNIANILLILGIAALIYPLKIKSDVSKHVLFSLVSVLLLSIFVIFGGNSLSAIFGLILILLFLGYVFWAYKTDDFTEKVSTKKFHIVASILFCFFGIVGLIIGGSWVVEGAIFIANSFNISTTLIGLTIVAVGTSLPELITAIIAVKKRRTDMVLGELIGSNIFNILWILGLTSLISEVLFTPENLVSLFVLFFISLILFVLTIIKKNSLGLKVGLVFILGYLLYLVCLFV